SIPPSGRRRHRRCIAQVSGLGASQVGAIMRIRRPILLIVFAWLASGLPGRAAPLTLEATISLHGVSGRIDHLAIDLPRKRLMVAELGNNPVDVIDLDQRPPVHRISGLREPQGIGYAERADIILIANAGDGSVRLISARDFSSAGKVDLGN